MVVVSLSQSGLVEFVWCFSRVFVAIFCMFSVFFDDRNVSGGADSSCFTSDECICMTIFMYSLK